MGQTLAEAVPAARARFAEADATLGWSLSQLCWQGPEAELTQTRVCQPALFVVGVVGAEALLARPEAPAVGACAGLSLGELTALTVAGAFDFATGLRVVAERGRLMQMACEASAGGMASVIGGTREDVAALCAQFDVDLANLNNPGQIVVSGEKDKVAALVAAVKGDKRFRMAVPLNVAGAYHSRLMEPARAAFAEFLATVEVHAPRVPVFTNVTGGPVTTPAQIREMLVRQVVSPVYWEDCMKACGALGLESFVECGPGGALAGMAKRTNPAWKVQPLAEAADLAKLAF